MTKTNWHVGDDAAARLASAIRAAVRNCGLAAGGPIHDAVIRPLEKVLCECDIAQQQQRNIELGFGGEVPVAERAKLRRLYEKREKLFARKER